MTSWEPLALFLLGLILFVTLTGLLVLFARRALTKPAHAHRHRRPFVPLGEWGLDRGIDRDAAADSAPHPPAP
jgi:hypothetical protein